MKYGILNWWKNFIMFGICLYEGDPSGGGGGDDETISKEAASKMVADAIAEATGGLKTKNQELLDKLNKTNDRLKAYGDITPEKIQEIMNKFEEDGDADLLKNGKIEELVAKKVDKIKAEYDGKLTAAEQRAIENEERAKLSDKRYNDRVVSQEVMKAAIEAGVRKEAMDDLLTAAKSLFTVGDDEELEARDSDGNLKKIGDKLLTPEHWLDSLKETKPHYWPESAGAGAQGNKGDKGGKSGDLSAQIEAAAAAGDMTTYRALRKKQAEGK